MLSNRDIERDRPVSDQVKNNTMDLDAGLGSGRRVGRAGPNFIYHRFERGHRNAGQGCR